MYIKTIDGYQRYLPLDNLCWLQRMKLLAEQPNYMGRKENLIRVFDAYRTLGFSRQMAYFEACKSQCWGNGVAKCKRSGLNVDSRTTWKPTLEPN
jgi:hypothetical protein